MPQGDTRPSFPLETSPPGWITHVARGVSRKQSRSSHHIASSRPGRLISNGHVRGPTSAVEAGLNLFKDQGRLRVSGSESPTWCGEMPRVARLGNAQDPSTGTVSYMNSPATGYVPPHLSPLQDMFSVSFIINVMLFSVLNHCAARANRWAPACNWMKISAYLAALPLFLNRKGRKPHFYHNCVRICVGACFSVQPNMYWRFASVHGRYQTR